MLRVRTVVDKEAAERMASRLPLMLAAAEQARAFAHAAGNELHHAFWEGQRDILAALIGLTSTRELYDPEEAEFEPIPDDVIAFGQGIPPIRTPRTKSLWR
jgi:hypothetical protein